ncbi:hypothetical protein [Oecophyllibacter saccharovorans]|uniref:Uncharacterized protein n=1 Tax=Oecophyllibacter saccharovorans TaxID=2558360 RepID=A0A506UM34_9PROT|nr:hypothetical protein [Oecophyllibacter saccharovorans]TPW34414.1 hypothetical protein E3202_07975 [Oecophyllibacter saccharovorans]
MALQRINLTGGSYQARAASVAAQRCLNLYPEPVPAQEGEPVAVAHYPTSGLAVFATLGAGPVRGLYQTTQGDLIAVDRNTVWLVRPDGTTKTLGQIDAGTTPVRMSDNGLALVIVDGQVPNGSVASGGWVIGLPGKAGAGDYSTLIPIQDPGFYGSPTVAMLDTFFLFVNPDTTNWYVSPSNYAGEDAFDALYVASDTTAMGTLIGLEVVGQYVWLFGRHQVEFWYDSGASDFPFQRVSGVTVEAGCVSPYAIARLPSCQGLANGGIMWLGRERSGLVRVFLGQQTAAQPVSTWPIEHVLQQLGDAALSAALGATYQEGGHVFYVLSVPGAASSWVYDVSTQLWHERCALDSAGAEVQIRPACWGAAYGRVFAGDRETAVLYTVSPDHPDDAGAPIKRQRAFPHLLTSGQRGIHRQLMLDMQQVGGCTVNVDWSDDRGATFGPAVGLALDAGGNTWPSLWRLGFARDRVYRLTWESTTANPGTPALMGVFLALDPVAT